VTIIIDDTASCGRFLRSSTNQLIMMALIVVKCVLRGRPQGGRAVFLVYFGGNVGVVEVDSGVALMAILDTLLHFPKFEVDSGRAARILRVDLVELIGKRSILCI